MYGVRPSVYLFVHHTRVCIQTAEHVIHPDPRNLESLTFSNTTFYDSCYFGAFIYGRPM